MITLSSAQIDAWIVMLIYPLTRVLALIASAPLLNNAALPRRVRLVLGLAITLAILPALPEMPRVAPTSWQGLWILAQQILIGVGMGFAMRIVYSAIDVAGEYIGLQMGLGFATFYDPVSGSQSPVVGELMNLLAMLIFLSVNGHLIYVATLVQSFTVIPVTVHPLMAESWLNLARLGGTLFATGLLLALPVLIALLITNVALAVLARSSPQLNIFAVGFPITLAGGFAALAFCLNYLAVPLQNLFEVGLNAMLGFARPGP